jgi:peptidoglycan/LPS O-acetylase OafA/YrhL
MNAGRQRLAGIDGLRAFAVVSVILFHMRPAVLPGGFVGVDIFFVISGYVVCGSLLKDSSERFGSFIAGFYVRRLVRIHPALIAAMIVAGVLSSMFIPAAYLSTNNEQIGYWAFFGLSNFALVNYQNDYFSRNNDYNPYAHTWSLGVEEQFYLLFPLLLFWILRSKQRRGVASILLPALLVVSLVWSAYETSRHLDRAYYLLPSRFWELATGALLCLAHKGGRLLPNAREASACAWGGLLLLVASVVMVSEKHFPFPLAIPPIVGTALGIAGVVTHGQSNLASRLLSSRLMAWVGRISYSAYLWHWIVVVLMRWTVGMGTGVTLVAALVLTFGLASTSYYLVETPGQRRHAYFRSRKPVTLMGGACLIVFCSFVFTKLGGQKIQSVIALSQVSRKKETWYPSWGKGPGPLFEGERGKRWSGKNLFVVGDSHAWAYGSLMRLLRTQDGVSTYLDSAPGGTLGSFVSVGNSDGGKREAKVLGQLAKLARPGDAVFLASLRVGRLSEQWGPYSDSEVKAMSDRSESSRLNAIEAGEEFIHKLQALQLAVIIDAPMPVFKAPPFRGSDWFNRGNPDVRGGFSVRREVLVAHRAPAMKALAEVRTKCKVRVWDPFEVFCSGTNCSAFDGAVPLFFDGDHLSGYGGEKLYPSFKSMLEQIWSAN